MCDEYKKRVTAIIYLLLKDGTVVTLNGIAITILIKQANIFDNNRLNIDFRYFIVNIDEYKVSHHRKSWIKWFSFSTGYWEKLPLFLINQCFDRLEVNKFSKIKILIKYEQGHLFYEIVWKWSLSNFLHFN